MLTYFSAPIAHLLRPPSVSSLNEIADFSCMVLIGFPIDTLLGPLRMSPVNQAGSVSEISPCHSLFCKHFDEII